MRYTYFALVISILLMSNQKLFADILFTNVPDSTVMFSDSVGLANYYSFDINNDGIMDFQIGVVHSHNMNIPHPPGDNYLVYIETNDSTKVCPEPLWPGDLIDDNLNYTSNARITAITAEGGPECKWYFDVEPDSVAYIGVEIIKNNQKHFAWVKLEACPYFFTVYEYAFNSISNQSMVAGQLD